MPASELTDLSRCAIHTLTNKPWSLRQCIDHYQRIGVGGISVWRETIEPIGTAEAARMLRDSNLRVPALVRGGFFPATTAAARQAAIDQNRAWIEQAAAIGAEMLVLVVGSVPGLALEESRRHVADGIAALLDQARQAGVKLAIEPLHPMYAADRSCINRLSDAREICQKLRDPMLGIALDVYHVWWDPDLASEIELAAKQGTLFAFHICDWRVNMRHPLNDRGLMGDGCIDLKAIRALVERAGFAGYNEVEVFSQQYWEMDQTEYLASIQRAYLRHA